MKFIIVHRIESEFGTKEVRVRLDEIKMYEEANCFITIDHYEKCTRIFLTKDWWINVTESLAEIDNAINNARGLIKNLFSVMDLENGSR